MSSTWRGVRAKMHGLSCSFSLLCGTDTHQLAAMGPRKRLLGVPPQGPSRCFLALQRPAPRLGGQLGVCVAQVSMGGY